MKITRKALLLIAQLLALGLMCYAISLIWLPAALIVGAVAVIAAIELQPPAEPKGLNAEADQATIAQIHELIKNGKDPFRNGVPPEDRWIRYVDLCTRPKYQAS